MTIRACPASGRRIAAELRPDASAYCPTCGRLVYVGRALVASAAPGGYRIPRHRAEAPR